MHEYTSALMITKRTVGSIFPPPKLTNRWGNVLNDEIEAIDRAVGEVCSPEQLDRIRQRLSELRPQHAVILTKYEPKESE